MAKRILGQTPESGNVPGCKSDTYSCTLPRARASYLDFTDALCKLNVRSDCVWCIACSGSCGDCHDEEAMSRAAREREVAASPFVTDLTQYGSRRALVLFHRVFSRPALTKRIFAAEPILASAGIAEPRRRYVYTRHQHDGYEVIYVDRGKYECLHNELRLSLPKDTILVIKPGDWHQDFLQPPLRYFTVKFHLASTTASPQAAGLFEDGVRTASQHFKADRRIFLPIIKSIQAESRRGDAFASEIQDALVLEFFWRLVRALAKAGVSKSLLGMTEGPQLTGDLLQLLQANISGRMTVTEMAAKMSMSESSLAHKCKRVFGMGPGKAFLMCKMEHALHLVRHTSMPIKEISSLLSFSSPYHFSATFKRFFGAAPANLRQTEQGEQERRPGAST